MTKLTDDNRCVECGKGVWERAGYWRNRALAAEKLLREYLMTPLLGSDYGNCNRAAKLTPR